MAFINYVLPYWKLFLILILTKSSAAIPVPLELEWSTESFGYDGPWNAIKTTIGGIEYDQSSELNLFPGVRWETWVISDKQCSLNGSDLCPAAQAGTYNDDVAWRQNTDVNLENMGKVASSFYQRGLDIVGPQPRRWMDSLAFHQEGEEALTIVKNVSLGLLRTQMAAYPGGQWYPLAAGCLSVGAPNETTDSFALDANYIPGDLWKRQVTPSNSFGMHMGSASTASMSGSFWFGGYDRNRVVGDVLAVGQDDRDQIYLQDISIEVTGGPSPFNFQSEDGLLAKGNSSIQGSLLVSIDGCSPYLSLPKSTCDSIASYLPVNYDEKLGLYLWDTLSPKYRNIVTSASVLSFSLSSNSNANSINIRVPFMHLNLTLTKPLAEEPTPYFPCYNSGSDAYVLGRAFLQDAFYGANWGPPKTTTWLAQAPGPKIPDIPQQVPIQEGDISIDPGENDWAASWEGIWEYDGKDDDNGNGEGDSAGTPPETPASNKGGGLSTGTKAGIGIGAAVGGLSIIGTLVLVCLRQRKSRSGAVEAASQPPPGGKTSENRFTLQSEYTAQSGLSPQGEFFRHSGYTTHSGLSPQGEFASEMPAVEVGNVASPYEIGDSRRHGHDATELP